MLHSSLDKPIPQNNQIRRKNPKRNHHSLISPPNFRRGILHAPPRPPVFPHSSSISLLPLPISKPNKVSPKCKKAKPLVTSPRTGDGKIDSKSTPPTVESRCLVFNGLGGSLGPDPNELPRFEKFSGSVVITLSPPPSSLPLPTFSLRPKLSCIAEAAEIDAGATESLRRLLRLR